MKYPKQKITNYIFFVIITAIIFVLFFFNIKGKQSVNIDFTKNKYSSISIIPTRQCLKKDNNIWIGKNIKELENGYFDAYISYSTDSFTLSFNKLYQENFELINSEYLNQILSYVDKLFSLSHMTLLQDKIEEKYCALKQGEKVENIPEVIKLETYTFSFSYEKNMLIITGEVL